MKMVDRKTGAVVDVADEQAQAAFMTGQFGIPDGMRLPVVTEGSRVGTVEGKDAAAAFDAAARPAAKQEFRDAEREGKYGGTLGTAGAAATGALRGAGMAFGAPTDPALVALAGAMGESHREFDPYEGDRRVTPEGEMRERLNAYKDLHPVASIGGELGGMVAASLVGGEGGLMSRAGALGEGAAGRIGRYAAEGGVIGGVSAANEAALGNEEVTAAKVLAGVTHGAIVGGATGGALSLASEAVSGARNQLGRFIGTMRPKDVESLAEKTFGFVPEGLGDKVQQGYSRIAAGISGKDPELISKFTSLSPEGAEARRIAVYDAPKIQEAAEKAVRENVDDILRSGDIVTSHGKGSLKASYVTRAVKTGNEEEVRNFAGNQLSKILEGAESQLTHADGVAPQFVKPIETVSRAIYQAQELIEAGGNANAFVQLDNLKRTIQKLTSTAYRSVNNIADPIEQMQARRTTQWLDNAAQDLRLGLENEHVFGQAALDQKEINAAWTQQIDASKRFHRALTTEVGRDPNNPYLQARGADPAKVAGYVKNLTNPNNDLTHAAVTDYVRGSENLANAMRKAYDLPPDAVKEVDSIASAAKSFRETLDTTTKSLVTANQYQQLLGETSDSFGSMLGVAGGIVGGLPGGIIGTALGGAGRAVANPGRTVAQLAAIERIASKVDSNITNGVRGFLSGAGKKAVGESGSVKMLAGAGGERATFETKLKEVMRLASNPDEQGARIASFTSQFDGVAPKIAGALTLATFRGTQYLAAHAPVGFAPRAEALAWGIEEAPLYSDAEMREWSRRAAVVNDPSVALHAMKHNMLTPEEAHALKMVHQPIYNQVQLEIRDQQAKHPKSLDYGKKLQLEILFETPLNRTLEKDFMRSVQASFSTPKEHAPAHKPMGNSLSASRMSVAQQLTK